ncbi:MAG: hypothetical protein J6X94_06635 [Lachnospiraceae bacterium]|nr:hypothetical protein [Lachnospiraceae bacterium]
MNFSSSLTARDKKLLNMLVYILIIFIFGWCLIRPLYRKTVEDQERIRIESALKAKNEAKVIGLSTAETLSNRFAEDLADSTSNYYEYMDSSEIDKLVTSYVLKRGLLARDLTINMPQGYVDEKPYLYSDIQTLDTAASQEVTLPENTEASVEDEVKSGSYYKEAVLSFITGYESSDMGIISNPMEEYTTGVRNVTSTESSGLLCVGLTLVVEGDIEAEQAVIDDLAHNPSVRITGFTWITLDPVTFILEDGSILVVESDQRQLQISVNLYMKDKAE